MSAQSVVGLAPREPAPPGFWPAGRSWTGAGPSRRTVVTAALVGVATALLAFVLLSVAAPRTGWFAPARTAPTQLAEGSPWPSPVPAIRSSELWYASTPAPGVRAELKLVLDNPLRPGAGHPTRTTLFVSATLLEDFRIRSTEPRLLMQPRRRPDGRYALVFPAPHPESLNWYRVYLEARKNAPRPPAVSFMLEGQPNLQEQPPLPAQVYVADRQADPVRVIPERLDGRAAGWAGNTVPSLTLYAVAIGSAAAAGCIAASWMLRR